MQNKEPAPPIAPDSASQSIAGFGSYSPGQAAFTFNPNMAGQNAQAAQGESQALSGMNNLGGQNWQDYVSNMQNQFANNSQSTFMNGLQPQLNKMQSDYASRFGGSTLNQPFVDAMHNEMQNTIAPEYAKIGEQVAAMGPQLAQDYLNQQGQILKANQGVTDQNLNQASTIMQMLMSGVNSQNQFNQGIYGDQAKIYDSQLSHPQPSTFGNIMGGLGAVSDLVSPFSSLLGGGGGGGGGTSQSAGETGNAAKALFSSLGMLGMLGI